MSTFYYCLLVFVILSVTSIQTSMAKDCSKPCPKCPSVTKCAFGVSIVPDECGCCKTCAKQLYESCDASNPCDHHKNLYCSFGDVDDTAGVCVAKPGRSCFLNGKVYLNGESFSPSCKVHCTCIDSDFGCMPRCPVSAKIPPNCEHPRLVLKPGKCCEEWICMKSSRKSVMPKINRQIKSNESRHGKHSPRPAVFNFAGKFLLFVLF
uniref:CCN family member 2-like n=1 Tax=Styela clava TaxID=7725 RepID=UPI0019396D93|nr:CCN family member 2-like [Styela clava]